MILRDSIVKLLLLLLLPLVFLSQTNSAKVELPFDKAHFKELNHFMLNLLASEIDASPLTSNFIYVTDGYGIQGMSYQSTDEAEAIKKIYQLKDAQSAELQEKVVLEQGEDLLNYFLENLHFENFISFRIAAKDKVEVKRFVLIAKAE